MLKWRYDLDSLTIESYRDFMVNLLKRRSKIVEELLAGILIRYAKVRPKVERRLKAHGEVFKLRAYILGHDVILKSPTGIVIPVRIVSNPSIVLDNTDVVIFMRLSSLGGHPIPNPWSRTFVGLSKVSLESLHGRVIVYGEPLLYPLLSVERVEDPRIYVSSGRELYYVRAIRPYKDVGPPNNSGEYVMTFTSSLNSDWRPEGMEPVRFNYRGEEYIISDYRDTFPLNDELMVIRPWISRFNVGGILIAGRDGAVIDTTSVVAHPELMPLSWERKTGGNYAVRLSKNEYLLFFHGVDEVFGTYHTYIALLSSDGELLGISPEPVITPRPRDYIGARPSTVFVCGAQLIKDKVLVSAGKDDEITIFLEAELDKLLSKVSYIKG